MSEDERVVREAWGEGLSEDSVEGAIFFYLGDSGANFSSWRVARKFTDERLEEIRKIGFDISLLKLIMSNMEKQKWMSHDWQADYDAVQRILIREQQALGALKEGLNG